MHLKPSQVILRIWRRFGAETPLKRGYTPAPETNKADIELVPVLYELDFDPAFCARFDCDAILNGRLQLLHTSMKVDWTPDSWSAKGMSPLWGFNMHYGEYLLPLAKRSIDTGDIRYLESAKKIIFSWIQGNPKARQATGWNSYTISMRAVNWLAFYGEARELLAVDADFSKAVNESLAQQYVHLARHLEKDILANHYLENLKALVILACYFCDTTTLELALPLLERQVSEQVLPDGAHFELSPMYQKIVFEDLLRVEACLRAQGRSSAIIVSKLKAMCDFVYSMERGTSRIPLFNDSGDNVAKSANSLIACAQNHFDVDPDYRDSFSDSGYYLLEGNCSGHSVKLIFDAGKPGPAYACGHAHCDMLSFEAFLDGEPWIVNSGTFAYQSENRLYYKRTGAHNAPQIAGVEQSECWAPFRMARMAAPLKVSAFDNRIMASMRDHAGNVLARTIELTDRGIRIIDENASGKTMSAHFHTLGAFETEGAWKSQVCPYAPDFGEAVSSVHLVISGRSRIDSRIEIEGNVTVFKEVCR